MSILEKFLRVIVMTGGKAEISRAPEGARE